MRRRAKLDENHVEITRALLRCGCSVQSLAAVGNGFPDLAVGRGGRTFLLEIKNHRRPPSGRRLTRCEKGWHETWRGHVAIVQTVEEALIAVGIVNSARREPPETPKVYGKPLSQVLAKWGEEEIF